MLRTFSISLLIVGASCWTATAPAHTSTRCPIPLRMPAPEALLAPPSVLSSLLPIGQQTAALPVSIRRATPADTLAISNLCTDSFFGTHELSDGPVIFAQRALIFAKVVAQISRRIRIEDGRECRLMVAEQRDTRAMVGCIDLAVHLFDKKDQRFELTNDQMPEGEARRYSWTPYVASLAVSSRSRRQGVGRQLVREAERLARSWGYRELALEVACCNLDAIDFYKKQGYRVLRSDVKGTGATIVENRGIYWRVLPVEKYVMRKSL